ncbi:hypothetical protein BLNAU_18790 [Blattamonas nauphoetae]|uniref:Uncharacterized protein n=1 Tax=Blattamonas nauphoetae TaxID=2049346 RepID=A0ABQ9X4N0_9EUKA|nr:hypothetical protein BLNAU_18790 [Blattamonas nauphoetae]
MLSNPDNSSQTIPTKDESTTKQSQERKELFEKLKKLETKSDEIRVCIAKELVILCLEDSGNENGIVTTLLEGRILPILENQLNRTLSVPVRVGFQVLFDAVLAVISKNEGVSLSKHFPSLLALSRDSNSRISEPVIATIGLITHRLSSSADVELFLQSGILESLVSSLRTHRDARVRKAIVVALGEIGVGLKMAVVRHEANEHSKLDELPTPAPREKKHDERGGEREGDEEESENEMPSFAKPMSNVSLSGCEVEALERVEWEKEDEGGADFVSRCRRGVGIVREGLIGVIRGWGKEKRGEEEVKKREKDEKGKKEGNKGEEEWREEDDVGVKLVAGSVCGAVFGEVFGVSPRWWAEGGVVGVRGSDIETLRVEMTRKLDEQQLTYEARLKNAEKEKEEMIKREEDMKQKENEMKTLIVELREHQPPALVTISEIKPMFSNSTKLSRSGDKFTNSLNGYCTVTFDHTLEKRIWHLYVFHCFLKKSARFESPNDHIGFIDSTEGAFSEGQYLGEYYTSLCFCPECHGKVSFKTGDEVVLEADMKARTCHLFVNSSQTNVFARGIPASIKLAVSLYEGNNVFEVKSFREVEKTKSRKQLSEIARNKEQNSDVLHLSQGDFELMDYPVISTTLQLEGMTSTITHANPERQAVVKELENDHSHHLNHDTKGHMGASHSLFLFDNSTVSMNKLILDCGSDGMALAKVTSSEVVVSSSKIVSNSKQTAFVVGIGQEGVGSSVSVIDCSHISSSSMVLLPLVRTSTCLPATPRDSSSTDTPHSDSVSPFLSVRGVGLALSNVSLILGTGPLLDFGLLSHDSTESDEIGLGEISTLLVGSVLRNVTSRGCCRSGLVLPNALSQKLVDNDVTLSTSHLSGTVCLDINAFGSFGCVNTSFSHCSSNAEPSSVLHSFTHQHFKQGDRFEYPKETTHITLAFHLCTFTSMTADEDGACVYVQTDYDVVTMSECSFQDIEGRNGGTLSVESWTEGEGTMTVSLCSFVNCVGQNFGAALYLLYSASLSIDKCFFNDMTTTTTACFGGAVSVYHTTTASITDSVFWLCTASDEYGAGGGVSVDYSLLSMESVQFRGNLAINGDDVCFSQAGSPTELKKRVSNCHTDRPDTSLFIFQHGFETGIIQEFGPTTIITDLQLTLFDAVFVGTIDVKTQHAVKGTMLLLLDNTGAYNPISESSSPPAACRVVVVNFPTLSTTGTSDVMSFGDKERLQFPSTYSLIAASISATPINFNPPLTVDLTVHPPFVRKFKYEPGKKLGEMLVSLEGRQLTPGNYSIHFEGNPSLTLIVSFDADQANKEVQVSSSVAVGSLGFSLIVPPFPTPFVFEVNKNKGGDGGSCRGLDNSCGSLDTAVETATKMRMKSIELPLVISDTLSKTLTISDESEVSVTKGGLIHPSLIVPETFSSDPLVVISVSNASLKLTDVDALIRSSSLELKFVLVSSGSFEFSNGVITYKPSSAANTKIDVSNSNLCSWTTGTIELVNSTAVLKSCNLTNLTQGAILQRGGYLSLGEVNFESNGPTNRDFPSSRRNVMCSSDGTLFVGGLTGDGRSHDFPGSGISAETCHAFGTVTTMSIPFIDTSQSKITHDKKTENFNLNLIGSGFIPCGLQLEVFTLLEDGSSEVSDALVVDTNTASTFTETEIVFILTPAHVANLSTKSDWIVRLIFGDTVLTNSWLLLREKPKSMLWLIPVIVLLVIVIAGVIVAIILICRCCSKKPAEKEEMLETTDEITPTTIEEAVSDQPEKESTAESAINVSDMPTELTEENTKDPSTTSEPNIEESEEEE